MDAITKAFFREFIENNELTNVDESTQFEYFSNYCVVSEENGGTNFNLGEVSTGKTQGIDGIAIIVNNKIVETTQEIGDLIQANNILDVKFILIQSKISSNFDSGQILNFIHCTKLFFLNDDSDIFKTDEIKKFLELKKYIYDNSKYMYKANPSVLMYFVTTGTWTNDKNLIAIMDQGKKELDSTNLFSKIDIISIGASQIQKLYRKIKEKSSATFLFNKNIALPNISNIDSGYYGIIPFSEFRKIIIDDNDNIKNVFEDNIRDFLGLDNDVNDAITKTLSNEKSITNFILLNNGITIVAEELRATGEKFSITNYQIVNGCQTSHVLYQNRDINGIDNVYIPIKIIATSKDDLKNQITTATNNQTAVKRDQLESLSKFQKQLEIYYNTKSKEDMKLYYERRTNQYNQLSIAKNKIITISMQIKAFASMFMNNPHEASGYYGTIVKKLQGKIFNSNDKLIMYYVSGLAYYKIENLFKNQSLDKKYRKSKNHILMLLRISVAGKELPQFNSKKMEDYCQKILSVLLDNNLLLKQIQKIIKIFDDNSDLFDLTDRKLFERKETTDLLLSLV